MDELYALVPADTSEQAIIELWLKQKQPATARAYLHDLQAFRIAVDKPLNTVWVSDILCYLDTIGHMARATRERQIASIKSFYSFARRVGYLPVNVADVIKLPKKIDTLSQRILPVSSVHRMIALEQDTRNHIILLLLYAGGLRVSELCQLQWRHCIERGDAGQISVLGKGEKQREILLSKDTWQAVLSLRSPSASGQDYVFVSKLYHTARNESGKLDTAQIWKIVRAAAIRADIMEDVSPHWLRHAHASHAIDSGVPISLVRDTLGHGDIRVTGKYVHAHPDDSSARKLGV